MDAFDRQNDNHFSLIQRVLINFRCRCCLFDLLFLTSLLIKYALNFDVSDDRLSLFSSDFFYLCLSLDVIQ